MGHTTMPMSNMTLFLLCAAMAIALTSAAVTEMDDSHDNILAESAVESAASADGVSDEIASLRTELRDFKSKVQIFMFNILENKVQIPDQQLQQTKAGLKADSADLVQQGWAKPKIGKKKITKERMKKALAKFGYGEEDLVAEGWAKPKIGKKKIT